ncbi:MAG: hypothetical protein KL863_06660 [Rhizobium sp.]|nr:hypothetical protein [Rhizobium sp.]
MSSLRILIAVFITAAASFVATSELRAMEILGPQTIEPPEVMEVPEVTVPEVETPEVNEIPFGAKLDTHLNKWNDPSTPKTSDAAPVTNISPLKVVPPDPALTNWTDQKMNDNKAIEAVIEREDKWKKTERQLDALEDLLTATPQSKRDEMIEAMTIAVLDALGACSVCEWERKTDREYFTRQVIAEFKKQQAERDEKRRSQPFDHERVRKMHPDWFRR